MGDFTQVLAQVATDVAGLATGKLARFKDQLVADAEAFAKAKQADIERWAGLVAQGQLSLDDAELLALGAKNLVQMRAQTYAGIAKIRLDELKGQITSIVLKAAIGLL